MRHMQCRNCPAAALAAQTRLTPLNLHPARPVQRRHARGLRLLQLALSTLGVVYGDIGESFGRSRGLGCMLRKRCSGANLPSPSRQPAASSAARCLLPDNAQHVSCCLLQAPLPYTSTALCSLRVPPTMSGWCWACAPPSFGPSHLSVGGCSCHRAGWWVVRAGGRLLVQSVADPSRSRWQWWPPPAST